MLELKSISKIYEVADQKQKALNKINIKFRENEFVSILGPSGSGKTTLLNIVGGLDQYTSGDLVINGISTKKYTDRDWDTYRNHRVGFVFQTYNLIPHQTALQNVELALTLSGVSKEERRRKAIKVLKEVGLGNHMNKRPNQMSGGQMQRVAIARALINDPDILLADEPTGALDSETSLQVLDLLKDIAKDKLVIMVTHNPELAINYSTRIVKLLDGEITDDSNPFDGVEEEKQHKKDKKTSMSFLTALSLSLNNLMTKKGRTILTAFAGSIGIIGIALILSLAHGINKYIERTEEETLSMYPLVIEKESVDMSAILQTMAGANERGEAYNDDKIHSVNIMGDMFKTMQEKVKRNDIKNFKTYLEDNKEIKNYVTEIDYNYKVQLNLYKNEPDKVIRVNPTTVLDTIGFGASSVSPLYSGFLSGYDVFFELFNDEEIMKRQYTLVAGEWPDNYNELVLEIGNNNEISDYTLYSLGILDQNELKVQFNNMISNKEIVFEDHEYNKEDFLGLTFKLVLNTDYYQKENGVWVDKSEDEEYMKSVIANSEEVKIVGIIKRNEEAVGGDSSYGLIGYRGELMDHLIKRINSSEIAKEQLSNKEINVFTGEKFMTSANIDIANMTPEQQAAFASMNSSKKTTSSYEENISVLGIADLDVPDSISIYPKDFDSKEKIIEIIDKYNEGKSEEDKIEYSDIVGIMMKSVTSIVNVISSVLIAFVAISLIVSSIMIAIITYISVIERTKEIGILRAIGASKKDISRVFNAETLIEGLAAGVFGIVTTIILNIPINIIIKKVVDISNISILPVGGAIILIIISVLLTVIAGLIPSKIASKKDPVEALRTE